MEGLEAATPGHLGRRELESEGPQPRHISLVSRRQVDVRHAASAQVVQA
jgi:hypothetical protein